MSAPLLPPPSDGGHGGEAPAAVVRVVFQKNIRLIRRDMPALRREVIITVLYFGILLLLNRNLPGSMAPPIAPGRVVTPLLTTANLGDALSKQSTDDFATAIQQGKNTVLVAPCGGGTAATGPVGQVQSHLAAAANSLNFTWPLNFTCAASKADVIQMAENSNTSIGLIAAVVFDDANRLETFTLYMDPRLIPYASYQSQASQHNFTASSGVPNNDTVDWFSSGTIALQHAVQNAVIAVSAARSAVAAPPSIVNFRQEPFLSYISASEGFSIGQIAPMYYVIIIVITSQAWVKQVVEEKEKGLRERLLVSGLSLHVVNLTWAATFVLKALTYVIAATVVSGLLVQKTSLLIFIVFVTLFALSIVALVLAVSTCFKTAKTAVAAYTFGAMIPGIVANYLTGVPRAFKLIASLFSPIAFVFSYRDMFDADAYDKSGVRWGDLMRPVGNPENGQSVGAGMFMLVLDTMIYTALAVYLGAIIPGNGTRSKPCCFCVYRRGGGVVPASTDEETNGTDLNNDKNKDVERADPGLTVGVSITNLHKDFTSPDGAKIKAVDGLSLDMFDGQVTCLLGHNGAGKTTTMSLLTGMLDVTRGNAKIYGMSLSTEMEAIRRNCGICTQHNLLWDSLTVLEHLELFGAIRGTPTRAAILREARALAEKVGLGGKLDAYAKALSGGMKRKLSVALALIGNPKVVYLDEPTAGMDPESRHALWNLITDMKRGKTVVLTTHHMDEADLLGDRIAIMSHGKLQVCGSSMYLKRTFGLGYALNVELKDANLSSAAGDAFDQLVTEHIPDAVINPRGLNGASLSYSLDMDNQASFPGLLDAVDAHSNGGGDVQSYGLELPTLEEVFIRLAGVQDVSTAERDRTGRPSSISSVGQSKPSSEGQKQELERGHAQSSFQLPLAAPPTRAPVSTQIATMLGKRILRAKRSPQTTFYQVVMPLIQLSFMFLVKASISNVFSGDQFRSIEATGKAQWANNRYLSNPLRVLAGGPKRVVDEQVMLMPFEQDRHSLHSYELSMTTGSTPFDFGNTMLEQGVSNGIDGSLCVGGFDFAAESANVNVTYNSTFSSSPSVLMGWLDTATLRAATDKDAPAFRPFIAALPSPATDNRTPDVHSIILGFALATFCASAFALIPAIAVTAIVEEKETHVLHQQLLSGADVRAYWCSNFLFDLLFYTPVAVMTLVLIVILDIAGLSNDYLMNVVVLLACYALHALPLAYIISHLFTKSVTAQNMTRAFFSLTGVIAGIAGGVVLQATKNDTVVTLLTLAFGILPNAALAQAFQRLTIMGGVCAAYKKATEGDSLPCPLDKPWSLGRHGVGIFVLEMLALSLIFSAIVVWIELKKLQPPKRDPQTGATVLDETLPNIDADIVEERARALRPAGQLDNVISVQRLRKVYPKGKEAVPKVAVADLCLSIKPGSCFGLLGPNGAGKTTAISMLTGTTWCTSGTASVAGVGIEDDMPAIYRRLGFCPQFHGCVVVCCCCSFFVGYLIVGSPRTFTCSFSLSLSLSLSPSSYRIDCSQR